MHFPASVANKRLTAELTLLDATLTKTRGMEVLWFQTLLVTLRRPSRTEQLLDFRLRKALFPRRLEFVAGDPGRQGWQPRCLRSEYEAESGDDGVSGKVHVRAVFVARLVIAVRGEILGLLIAPFRRMARILDSFIDRKRRHAHAGQAEMVRTVIVSRLRPRVRTDCQAKILRGRLYYGIKCRPFRAADFHFFRRSQRRHIVEIQI